MRWQEAISDLEIAINGDPNHAHLHYAALATAHQQLGNKELAEIYKGQSLRVGRARQLASN